MNPMRERRQATINDLRLAINCLPRKTRVAMLEGIRSNEIIVGAYADGEGVCPMLAAHRAGGRTSFITFAKAWDSYAFRGTRGRLARRATSRELLVLRTHLEVSLLEDEVPAADLRAAMADHRELVARRKPTARERTVQREQTVRPGDPDRRPELKSRPGWAWTRVVRRYDDYQRVLERLQAEHRALVESERELAGRR
jgi:hypothetical protein